MSPDLPSIDPGQPGSRERIRSLFAGLLDEGSAPVLHGATRGDGVGAEPPVDLHLTPRPPMPPAFDPDRVGALPERPPTGTQRAIHLHAAELPALNEALARGWRVLHLVPSVDGFLCVLGYVGWEG